MLGCAYCLILILMIYFIQFTAALDNGKFTYKNIASNRDENILQLRCAADCSLDNTLVSIAIYNVSSMMQMVVWRVGKPALAFKQPSLDISYYVRAEYFGEDSQCTLELVIINLFMPTSFQLGCNTSVINTMASYSSRSTIVTIDKGASQDGQHSMSTTTLGIVIVLIIVLFLLAVFFLSMWIRGLCRQRNNILYQTPPHSEINHNHTHYGDALSVSSFAKSPSNFSVHRESVFKFPTNNGSIRKTTSRSDTNISSHRLGYPPLPPAPPPKTFQKDRASTHPSSACSSIKITYDRPKDAIEPDFSEDGDVTSSSIEHHHDYSRSLSHRNSKQNTGFYSCVPVNSVDI
uniref:Fibronectin type-III domain-containing protein n=1 Tax=Arion vulgaris TaxID=1028688 RepID=A0A0B6ZD73_9EUPU